MANIRKFNYKAAKASNGHGSFYVHVDMEELSYDILTNTSKIKITCRILGNGYSKDGISGTGAWASGPTKSMSLQWYDDKQGGPTQKTSGSWDQGGKSSGGSYFGCPTLETEFTVQHKEDGTLAGYAKAVLTGTESDYAPKNVSVETELTNLTYIPPLAKIINTNIITTYSGNALNTSEISETLFNPELFYLKIKVFTSQLSTPIKTITVGQTTSILFTLNKEEMTELISRNSIGAGETYSIKPYIVIESYNDSGYSELIGYTTYNNWTINLINLLPEGNKNFLFEDMSSVLYKELAGNEISVTHIIKGLTSLKVKYTPILKNTNIIKQNTAKINGGNAIVNSTYIERTFLPNSANFDISLDDGRNNNLKDNIQSSISVINYISLTNRNNSERNGKSKNRFKIDIAGQFFGGNFATGSNQLTASYRIYQKNTTPSSYTNFTSSEITLNRSTNTYRIIKQLDDDHDNGIDYDKEYIFEYKISDSTGNQQNPSFEILKGVPVIGWTNNEFFINGDNIMPIGYVISFNNNNDYSNYCKYEWESIGSITTSESETIYFWKRVN